MNSVLTWLGGLTPTNWIAAAALAVSIGHVMWQVRQKHRDRRPDLTLHGVRWYAGPREPPNGLFQDRYGDWQVGRFTARVLPNRSSVIVAAGLAPPWWWGRFGWIRGDQVRFSGPERSWQMEAASTGPRGPASVLIVPPVRPPRRLRPERGVRVWVRTGSGHRVVSREPIRYDKLAPPR